MGREGFRRGQLLVAPRVPLPCPQVEGYTKAEVASDTLVALSRNHFSVVMYEMQHRLKPLDLTDEFVIITLAKLANGNGGGRPRPSPWPLRLAQCSPGPCPFPPPFISLLPLLWLSSFSSPWVSLCC